MGFAVLQIEWGGGGEEFHYAGQKKYRLLKKNFQFPANIYELNIGTKVPFSVLLG